MGEGEEARVRSMSNQNIENGKKNEKKRESGKEKKKKIIPSIGRIKSRLRKGENKIRKRETKK